MAADHVARQNLQLLRALGIDDTRIEIPVRAVQSEVADDVQQATGPRYGVINPGAGWPNKQWPPEKFGAVAAAIQKSRGLPWVVVWGPGEESLARRVEEASSGSTMLAPPTSLADLMALVQRAAIVVAGDTGPVHLAAAAGTPVVGLYGPTNPARNGPWSPERPLRLALRSLPVSSQAALHGGGVVPRHDRGGRGHRRRRAAFETMRASRLRVLAPS